MKLHLILFLLTFCTTVVSSQINEFDLTVNSSGWYSKKTVPSDSGDIKTFKKFFTFMPGIEIFIGQTTSLKIMYTYTKSNRIFYEDLFFFPPEPPINYKSTWHGIAVEGRKYFIPGRIQPYLDIPIIFSKGKTTTDHNVDGTIETTNKSTQIKIAPEVGISWKVAKFLRLSAAISPLFFSQEWTKNSHIIQMNFNQFNLLNLGLSYIVFEKKSKKVSL